ncbi:hypothetical protein K7X08_009378 [Anisodus acutangulus]|uniref:Uncharacterized protein n=1 Tax=Anisodus acutangulus TaxID=402998 RepID=A0A9Q1MZ82_9SOLA|nr:hypothetical protein K7X08_009378 [Anisodus acutangulus]
MLKRVSRHYFPIFRVPRSQTSDNFGHFEEASKIPGRPIHNSVYDPRYAAIDLPVDPHLRALKQNPNFALPSATRNGSSTTNNSRTDYAPRVPRLHQSSSDSGREVVKEEHRHSRIDYPSMIRSLPNSLYDPSYATIGLPVDPHLRALKLNPNFRMPSATRDVNKEI